MNSVQAISLYEAINPYSSALHRANSNYSAVVGSDLVRLLDWRPVTARARYAHEAVRRMISDANYPCVGAKSALATGAYRFGQYKALASADAVAGLARDLCAFTAELAHMPARFATFLATFSGEEPDGEAAFEEKLWATLQALHDEDAGEFRYDPTVSSDPEAANFSFSFSGTAYFIVGMHPRASRFARRAPVATIAFNAHRQFVDLRESGDYDRFTQVVRNRDRSLQGSLNPNLAPFGTVSEARQYSGRAVEEAWRCPFHP